VDRFQGATVSKDGYPICEDTEASEKTKKLVPLILSIMHAEDK